MKKLLLFAIVLSIAFNASTQGLKSVDKAILLNSKVYSNKVQFDFGAITKADSLKIYKKQKEDTGWTLIANLPTTTTSFVDSPFVSGNDLEYRFYKDAVNDTVDGNTYVYTGIELPLKEYRGKIILIIDSTFKNSPCSGNS